MRQAGESSGYLAVPLALILVVAFAAALATPPQQASAELPGATGLGHWIESTDYGSPSGTSGATGIALNLLSCAVWSGYVYCVGGFGAPTSTGDITSKVFYAPLTLSGIGAWTETTDYGAASGTSGSGGVPIDAQSCVTDGGYIYCVGGQTYVNGTYSQVSDVFYAPVSASGVGAWTETIDYGAASGSSGTGGLQLYRPSCATSSSYIYCVGGVLAAGKGTETFYAQLSSSGVGPWTETTDYGASSGTTGTGGVSPSEPSCAVAGGYVYCIGGDGSAVFYAPVSSTGIGAWVETTDYGASSGAAGSGGIQVDATGCAAYSSYILCVGGRNASAPDDTTMSRSYFAPVSASGVGAWNRTTDYGDAAIVMSNTALFEWYIQPGCALFGVTGTGSAGAAGAESYIVHTVPTPSFCIPAVETTSVTTTPTVSTTTTSTSTPSTSTSETVSTTSPTTTTPTTPPTSTQTVVPTTTTTTSSVGVGVGVGLPWIWIGVGIVGLVVVGSILLFVRRRGTTVGTPPEAPPPQPPPSPPPPTSSPPPPEVITRCGPDITDQVLGTMLNMMNDFFHWGPETQANALSALFGTSYARAWDIYEIAPAGYENTFKPYEGECMKPKDSCYPSVMFLENCHNPMVVNYVQWGVLARLNEWKKGGSVGSYDDTWFYTAHNMRSGPLPPPPNVSATPGAQATSAPTYSDPNFPDQVAMAKVGWKLADDYIVRKNLNKLPYKLSQVNTGALKAILEMFEDKGRSMAKCRKGCGKFHSAMARNVCFQYIFGDMRGELVLLDDL